MSRWISSIQSRSKFLSMPNFCRQISQRQVVYGISRFHASLTVTVNFCAMNRHFRHLFWMFLIASDVCSHLIHSLDCNQRLSDDKASGKEGDRAVSLSVGNYDSRAQLTCHDKSNHMSEPVWRHFTGTSQPRVTLAPRCKTVFR